METNLTKMSEPHAAAGQLLNPTSFIGSSDKFVANHFLLFSVRDEKISPSNGTKFSGCTIMRLTRAFVAEVSDTSLAP